MGNVGTSVNQTRHVQKIILMKKYFINNLIRLSYERKFKIWFLTIKLMKFQPFWKLSSHNFGHQTNQLNARCFQSKWSITLNLENITRLFLYWIGHLWTRITWTVLFISWHSHQKTFSLYQLIRMELKLQSNQKISLGYFAYKWTSTPADDPKLWTHCSQSNILKE